MADGKDAIISIHRCYADAILAGSKTVELRRRIPELSSNTRLWIYATRPIGAVVGYSTIHGVDRAAPGTIWKKYGAGSGVNYTEFRDYFDGASEAIAILLATARRIGPIGIDQLRQIRDAFHPPRVLTRLTTQEAGKLQKLAGI